jgi:transcriptional regulator with XRE-family HTH domain
VDKLPKPVSDHTQRLRARKLSGLTQLELAKRADISQSSLSHYERGHEVLPAEKLAKLDAALNEALQDRRKELDTAQTRVNMVFLHVNLLIGMISNSAGKAVVVGPFYATLSRLVSRLWVPPFLRYSNRFCQ